MAFYKIKPNTLKKLGNCFTARVRSKKLNKDITQSFKSMEEAESFAHSKKAEFEVLENPKSINLAKKDILLSNIQTLTLVERPTILDLVTTFLNHKTDVLKPMSKTTTDSLKQSIKYNLANLYLDQVTYTELTQFCRERLSGAEPSTVRIDISSLSSVIKQINKIDQRCLPNPFEDFYGQLLHDGFIENSGTRHQRLKEGQDIDLLKAAKNYSNSPKVSTRYDILISLSISTCLRRTALIMLHWEDICFDSNTITIKKDKDTLTHKGSNSDDVHVAPMTSRTRHTLLQLKEISATKSGRIFDINPGSYTSAYSKIVQQAGIEDIRLLDLRREGVSRLLEEGYSVIEIAQFTGHKDLTMIRKVYNAMRTQKKIRKHNTLH